MKEEKEKSSLSKHSFLTDHVIDYLPDILAKDLNVFILCVREILKIQDYYAHQSLNENTGSFLASLWSLFALYFIAHVIIQFFISCWPKLKLNIFCTYLNLPS